VSETAEGEALWRLDLDGFVPAELHMSVLNASSAVVQLSDS
jgi:hypothetical protein